MYVYWSTFLLYAMRLDQLWNLFVFLSYSFMIPPCAPSAYVVNCFRVPFSFNYFCGVHLKGNFECNLHCFCRNFSRAATRSSLLLSFILSFLSMYLFSTVTYLILHTHIWSLRTWHILWRFCVSCIHGIKAYLVVFSFAFSTLIFKVHSEKEMSLK